MLTIRGATKEEKRELGELVRELRRANNHDNQEEQVAAWEALDIAGWGGPDMGDTKADADNWSDALQEGMDGRKKRTIVGTYMGGELWLKWVNTRMLVPSK